MQSLDDTLLRELRNHLEEDKKAATRQIAELTKQDPFADPEHVNDNAASDTEANEESGHDRVSAIIEELTKQLGETEAALARMDAGTYGRCANCQQFIDTQRLRILPTATLCLTCEQGKK